MENIYDGNAARDARDIGKPKSTLKLPNIELKKWMIEEIKELRELPITLSQMSNMTLRDISNIKMIIKYLKFLNDEKKIQVNLRDKQTIIYKYISMVQQRSKRNLPIDELIEELKKALLGQLNSQKLYDNFGINDSIFLNKQEYREIIEKQETEQACRDLLEYADSELKNQGGGFDIYVEGMMFPGFIEKIYNIWNFLDNRYIEEEEFKSIVGRNISFKPICGFKWEYYFSEIDLDKILNEFTKNTTQPQKTTKVTENNNNNKEGFPKFNQNDNPKAEQPPLNNGSTLDTQEMSPYPNNDKRDGENFGEECWSNIEEKLNNKLRNSNSTYSVEIRENTDKDIKLDEKTIIISKNYIIELMLNYKPKIDEIVERIYNYIDRRTNGNVNIGKPTEGNIPVKVKPKLKKGRDEKQKGVEVRVVAQRKERVPKGVEVRVVAQREERVPKRVKVRVAQR